MKIKTTLIFFFCLGELFSQSAICSYKYRKRIAFDPAQVSGPSDLSNFIAMIKITSDNDLRVVGSSGHVENINGYDIVFAADDGVTLLNFQLEKYTSTSGQYTAWVKIPTLSTSIKTYIYMYYGNTAISTDQSTPATVWSNYYGVWHLETAAFATDNSGNGYTLTNYSTTSQSPAFINDGRANSGAQTMDVAASFPNITTNFTISGWAYTTDKTKMGQRIFCDDLNNSGGYALSIGDNGNAALRFFSRGSSAVILDSPNNTIANNTWYYCVGVADITGGVKTLYINGVQVATNAFTGWGTDAGNASLSGEPNGSAESANKLQGQIDEVHIAKSALSADWILTEYNNENSPSTFYTITPEPYIWSGSTSQNWNIATNWIGGSVPPADADIIIPLVVTNQPKLNANEQISSIWIQSGSTLTFGNNKTLSLRFDMTNCGIITAGGNGEIVCNSTSSYIQNQYFSGSGTFSLNDLTVNNTFSSLPKLILNKDVNVSGALTLTSGITYTTATNILALSSTSTSTSGSSLSFVDGPMKKTGNSAFVFPMGNGTVWARIGIGAPGVATDAFTATYHFAPYASLLPVTAPLAYVSSVEHWILDRTTGTSNVKVTLFWENGARSGINTFSSDLRVGHYTTANTWVDEGSALTGAIAAGTVTSTAAVTSFSPFTFASLTSSWAINPLPIELLNFNASVCDKNVCLDWSTATETNNDYFTVEHSQDGINFEQVGVVDGAGNSTSILNYSLVDNAPYEGVSYYRLKQTDFNGAFTYSNIETVNFTANSDFSFDIYPNPSDGTAFNIVLTADKDEEVLVVVYDATGRETYSKIMISGENNDNVFAIDPSGKLAAGMYMITATSKQNITNKKLIVK
jgi:hypothetical protein